MVTLLQLFLLSPPVATNWRWRNRGKTHKIEQYLNEDVKHPLSFLWTFTHMPVPSITKQLQINKKFDINYLIAYENLSTGYEQVCNKLNIKDLKMKRAKCLIDRFVKKYL